MMQIPQTMLNVSLIYFKRVAIYYEHWMHEFVQIQVFQWFYVFQMNQTDKISKFKSKPKSNGYN